MGLRRPSGIDNVTAIMRLPMLADENDLYALLTGEAPTRGHLMSFLHEAAHHLCFRQTLGNILGGSVVCASGAAYRTLVAESGRSGSGASFAWEAFDHHARARGATALLRPLAEGIALFAEFDLFSGSQSTIQSDVYMAATRLFVDPASGPLGTSEIRAAYAAGTATDDELVAATGLAMANLLANERTEAAAVDRKVDLLLQPLSPAAGGYLPGYLTVKRLYWQSLLGEHRLMNEPDLFFQYLLSYVYGDPVLAALLIDPSASPDQALQRFANRLHQRLRDLPDVVTGHLDLFEQATQSSDTATWLDSLGIDPGELGIAEPVLQRFQHRVNTPDDSEDIVPGMAVATLTQRRYLYLGELPSSVTIDGGRARIEIDGRPVLDVPVTPRAGASTSADRIHLISPQERAFAPVAAVFEQDEEVVAVAWGRWTQTAQARQTDEILHRRPAVQRSRRVARQGALLVDAALAGSAWGAAMADLDRQIAGAVDAIYLPRVLDTADAGILADHVRRMERFGIAGVVPDTETVAAMARLGLCTSVKNAEPKVRGIFDARGWSYDDTLARVGGALRGTHVGTVFHSSAGGGVVACLP